MLHQPDAAQDHARAHDDRAQHAVEQRAALQFRRHREIGEDHHEDEHVVYRQRLLDEVTGQELQRLEVGDLSPRRAVQVPPEQGGEGQGQRDPCSDPGPCLLHRDPVRLVTAQDEQVERQHGHDEDDEACPQRGRTDADQFHLHRPPDVSSFRGSDTFLHDGKVGDEKNNDGLHALFLETFMVTIPSARDQ